MASYAGQVVTAAPAAFKGPTGGDPQRVREEIVKDAAALAARQAKTHIGREITAMEERLIKTLTEKAAGDTYDKGKAAGVEIGLAKAKAGRIWISMAIAIVAAGFGVLATSMVYEKAASFGAAFSRATSMNDDLRRDLNQKMAPAE